MTVGNWHNGFDRLIKAVDDLKAQAVIGDEVWAQRGPGRYMPAHFESVAYCSHSEFQKLLSEASIVITHAGMGTIGQAVEMGKSVIVVPRKSSLGEHVDDHQFATARQLEEEHKVLVAYETSDLAARIKEAVAFKPACGSGDAGKIVSVISHFLTDVAAEKKKRQ